MTTSVFLPVLGDSVTTATVTRWLKAVGDTVAADEPLLEVSTDKVDTEIPSPVAGTLLSLHVEEDEEVGVGAELAIIGDVEDANIGGSGSTGSDTAARPTAASRPASMPEIGRSLEEVAASNAAATTEPAEASDTSPPRAGARRAGTRGGTRRRIHLARHQARSTRQDREDLPPPEGHRHPHGGVAAGLRATHIGG